MRTAPTWSSWLAVEYPVDPGQYAPHLDTHADWQGPVKLITCLAGGRLTAMRRTELCIARTGQGVVGECEFDSDVEQQDRQLVRQLSRSITIWHRQEKLREWSGPDAEALVHWLRDAGYEAVIDQQEYLRFTLQRSGGTGQVRLIREPGRLRFILPLGRWRDLSDEAAAAMLELATRANRSTRLARVVWKSETDAGSICEAQIDLTGMPWQAPAGPCLAEFWEQLIGQAARSLEAVFVRTATELAALADPRNIGLSQTLLALMAS